jgi:hypothetical protein
MHKLASPSKVRDLLMGLRQFARECSNEHVAGISRAAEFGSYSASRNNALAEAGNWLERERLLLSAVRALELAVPVAAVDPVGSDAVADPRPRAADSVSGHGRED